MVIGKMFTKLVQSIPSWEMTKYYGRVCVYQLKCMKYRIQTSEAWFNFRCKFLPGDIQVDDSKSGKTNQRESQIDKKRMTTEIQEKSKAWIAEKLCQSNQASLEPKEKEKSKLPSERDSKEKQ